ncbi:MAG: sigma-70 family RNA polymerase sigma factor [Bacteroidales bacterium]
MLSEEQLIERCRKNDRKAQKILYDKYASLMLAICMRYVYERSEAEDILQEGFLKIFTKISEFEGRGSFEGWMKRVFINTAITLYHKNSKHNKNHYNIDDVHVIKSEKPAFGESEFTNEELFNIIHSLPEGYKLVFNLYALEGYKHKEIAEMLNIDINTSKSQYSRAKKLIRKKLEGYGKILIGSIEEEEEEEEEEI